nr:immunoglobulin heavy chain junction region [Mus musculus]
LLLCKLWLRRLLVLR